jgi:hypothetical protein
MCRQHETLDCRKLHKQLSNLASSAGISLDESGGGKKFGEVENFFFKTYSQARTHREACGGGYIKLMSQKR